MTIEERLVSQIAHDASQLARLVERAHEHHGRRMQTANDRHRYANDQAQSSYRVALHEADRTFGRALHRAQVQVADLYRSGGTAFTDWADPRWDDWQPPAQPTDTPEWVRLGQLLELTPTGGEVALPAVAHLASGYHLIVKAGSLAKRTAADALQAIIFRLLASTQPARLRLSLLDPSHLLSHAGTLLSLTASDPALVTGGVWSEPEDIEAVLAYLCRTVAEESRPYGRSAGVTQRLVAVLSYPSGFSQQAADHLQTLLGLRDARKVTLLMLWDPSGSLPGRFDPAQLEQSATVIRWNGERFGWEDNELRSCKLELDSAPNGALTQALVTAVGASALQILPSESVLDQTLPASDEWWQESTTDGLCTPIGVCCGGKPAMIRMGATTSHLLVTGGRDAGRGALLHAFLMRLAVSDRPDHLRLYLLSMPRGLDLRAVAAHWLPHAQVVAVECDREYALSVLELLAGEALASSADATARDPEKPGTRSAGSRVQQVLVLDEFTQLLVGEDSIAGRANELLCRLVMKGHQGGAQVILGTTEAHLPEAARVVADRFRARVTFASSQVAVMDGSMPDRSLAKGLAIYNDAERKPWGDHLVRVQTVTEANATKLLAQLQARSGRLSAQFPPQAYYDPKWLSNIERCWPLDRLLTGRHVFPPFPKDEVPGLSLGAITISAWLGERPRLGQSAAASFCSREARNLLVVSDDELASGMLAAIIVSLGIQVRREHSRPVAAEKAPLLRVVDFTSGKLAVLARVAGALGRTVEIITGRELPVVLARVDQLVDRRFHSQFQSAEQDVSSIPYLAPMFLVLAGLHYALSSNRTFDGGASERLASAERLAKIVQLGPSVGVHVIAWCDAIPSFDAVLGPTMLPEFGIRAMARTSEEDSIVALGSSAASHLKNLDALLFDQQSVTLQAFRPYGEPKDVWLGRVREHARGDANASGG